MIELSISKPTFFNGPHNLDLKLNNINKDDMKISYWDNIKYGINDKLSKIHSGGLLNGFLCLMVLFFMFGFVFSFLYFKDYSFL